MKTDQVRMSEDVDWSSAKDMDSNNEEMQERTLAPGLYLVATPIGNLEDITLRALRVLRTVDRIACEDTRQTQKLLNHYEIRTPTVSYHMHNEAGRAIELAVALKTGARIAVVSDAGTPGIADPGGQIAAAAIAAGVAVYAVPGANAAISALVASGLAGSAVAENGSNAEQFTFNGFLPSKQGQRRTALEALRQKSDASIGTQIFYEAPHRILETLSDIQTIFGPTQHVVVARELTKLHEEYLRGAVGEVRKRLAERGSVRGEIVLLFLPTTDFDSVSPASSIAAEVRALMASENLAEKDALKRVARVRGMGKSEAYRELQRDRSR